MTKHTLPKPLRKSLHDCIEPDEQEWIDEYNKFRRFMKDKSAIMRRLRSRFERRARTGYVLLANRPKTPSNLRRTRAIATKTLPTEGNMWVLMVYFDSTRTDYLVVGPFSPDVPREGVLMLAKVKWPGAIEIDTVGLSGMNITNGG